MLWKLRFDFLDSHWPPNTQKTRAEMIWNIFKILGHPINTRLFGLKFAMIFSLETDYNVFKW